MGRQLDSVTSYAKSVVAGKLVAGELVRLACERHLRDLDTGHLRGLRWDPVAAERAIQFFRFLRHSKGEWAGHRFELERWQQFIIGSIFGWKNAAGFRRFRTAYNEVARKNGKSTLAAGVGLELLVADDEPGAEIFTAATKRDQARIVHGEAVRMVRRSPGLRKRISIHKDNLAIEERAAFYRPLGADADTMDGLNPHGSIIDEFHAHKTRALFDVLDTATGARRQPLLFIISTAGFDQTSVCFEQHTYSEDVLKGTVADDSHFAYIATIDAGDDWSDERVWPKANPNYGISVKPEDMRRLRDQALQLPSKQNPFLRLRLNVWTQQVDRWISLPLWDAQAGRVDEARLAGRKCYGGLDLAAVSDICAWVMVFPHDDDPETVDVLPRFWVPKAKVQDVHNRYHSQYADWVRAGFLKEIDGNAIDFGFVRKQVLEDAQTFQVVDLNIDRLFNGHETAVLLGQERMQVAVMGQGFYGMAAPMKEFERRLLAKKIIHGGNPVLRWMADNVAVLHDAADNVKPDKAHSQGKIDGIVALVMAIDRATRHLTGGSIYERRGVLTV
jgi:phage terminase large subunit-like protein